jgi:hypothetical protein
MNIVFFNNKLSNESDSLIDQMTIIKRTKFKDLNK